MLLHFPDRPVQPSQLLWEGSIQSYAIINARRLLVHMSTIVYSQESSWVNWSNIEWKILLKVLRPQHMFQTRVLLVESPKLYPWAIALSTYSVVSNPQDCSKRFTIYSLADLFNRTQSRLLWEAFSHVYTYIHHCHCSQVLIQLSEWAM